MNIFERLGFGLKGAKETWEAEKKAREASVMESEKKAIMREYSPEEIEEYKKKKEKILGDIGWESEGDYSLEVWEKLNETKVEGVMDIFESEALKDCRGKAGVLLRENVRDIETVPYTEIIEKLEKLRDKEEDNDMVKVIDNLIRDYNFYLCSS